MQLFATPEEDIIYAGIRKANQIITCGYARENPVQATIVNIIIYLLLIVLMTAIAV